MDTPPGAGRLPGSSLYSSHGGEGYEHMSYPRPAAQPPSLALCRCIPQAPPQAKAGPASIRQMIIQEIE